MEAIELVQKECPGQLADFLGCVEANADSWSVQCIDLKHRLTACSQNISGIRAASKRCERQVNAYEQCLKVHGHKGEQQIVEQCGGQALQELMHCTSSQAAQKRAT